MSVDWGAGNYERTAAELEPVARAVLQRASLQPGEELIDLACGTGNAALLAAQRGARVVGVDGSPRLLDVARGRARALAVDVDWRAGDLLALPVQNGAADVVLSVFGVIFAPDPGKALREIARIARPGARLLVSAWVPAGPIDAMLGAAGRIVARITQAPPPERFARHDAAQLRSLAHAAGLSLEATTAGELAIRDRSPEAYVAAGREHPIALAIRPIVARAGAQAEVTDAMVAALRDGNEDPTGFLAHSPYVIHELRRA